MNRKLVIGCATTVFSLIGASAVASAFTVSPMAGAGSMAPTEQQLDAAITMGNCQLKCYGSWRCYPSCVQQNAAPTKRITSAFGKA
jgi:hypothetical protein